VVLSTGAAPLGPDVEALRQTLTKVWYTRRASRTDAAADRVSPTISRQRVGRLKGLSAAWVLQHSICDSPFSHVGLYNGHVQAGVECEVREGGDVSPSGGLDLGASSNVTGLPDYEAMGPAEVRMPSYFSLSHKHRGTGRGEFTTCQGHPSLTPLLSHVLFVFP
jgi:hypothetical protein